MTDSDPPAGTATTDRTPVRPAWRAVIDRFGAAALLAIVVGAIAAMMYAARRQGHWWGDDWALYLRQAEGLLHGHPNRVLTENEFTVTASDGAEFSPPLYPWGYPILLAPFVAVVGTDVDRLMVVGVLGACVFACCWFWLARHRIGYWPALIGAVAATTTPLLFSWGELIQSEWPFLAAVGVGLVLVESAVRRDALIGDGARTARLVGLGLIACLTFSVRREGLAMLAAIGGAQLAALWIHGLPIGQVRQKWGRLALRLATPYVAFAAAALALQVTLPSTVVPHYRGNSVLNGWRMRGRLMHNLAQITGLQREWDHDPMVLGSSRLGYVALVTLFVLALAGAVYGSIRCRHRDLHLVTYAIAAYLIGGTARSPVNRYMSTVGVTLTLLATGFVYTIVRRWSRPMVAGIVVALPLLGIVAGNMANIHLRIEAADRMRATGGVEWGPTHPAAIEMFEQVEALTSPNQIVASPKARAMVLETGRPSIQVDEYRPIPPDVDIALIVAERNTKVATTLLKDPDHYEVVWSNLRFYLFEPV